MGLNKGIENQYGINFDYHRINDVHIIVTENGIQVRMTVSSYINEHARRTGKAAYKTVNIIDGADFALTPFYLLLKAKFADFSDAADVFEQAQQNEKRRILYTTQTLQGRLISQQEEKAETEESAEAENPVTEQIEEAEPITLEEASLENNSESETETTENDDISGAVSTDENIENTQE